MSYTVIADKIETRSITEGKVPRYIVKATAMVANKRDIYKYSKNPDGSFKTLSSIFTPHCLDSIREQAKHKKLFIDSQHELALNANIKSVLKDKLKDDELKQIDSMLRTKMLPLAKLNEINIEDNKLDIEAELNPMFREVDSDHQKYFDAVWYSLENGFLNGASVNFANSVVIDENGDTRIDDIDVLGFSFVDSPALPDNSIYEVAIRAIQEGINMRGSEKMVEDELKKLEDERKKLADERLAFEKQKLEADKKLEMDKQAMEMKKLQDELSAKAEALKKAEAENEAIKRKGVTPSNTPSQPKSYGTEFYKEQLKEITAKHDKTMETLRNGKIPLVDNTCSGLGELIALQAKAGDPLAGLSPEDIEEVRRSKLYDRSSSDIIAPRLQAVAR